MSSGEDGYITRGESERKQRGGLGAGTPALSRQVAEQEIAKENGKEPPQRKEENQQKPLFQEGSRDPRSPQLPQG